MKFCVFYCLVFFAGARAVYAQSVADRRKLKIDSLKEILALTLQDTNRVKILVELASWYDLNSDFQQVDKCATPALHLATQLNYARGKSDALYWKGAFHYRAGNFDSALFYYFPGAKIAEERKFEKTCGIFYTAIGNVYTNVGKYDSALLNYKKSFPYFARVKDQKRIAALYNNYGNIYLRLGDYSKAMENYFASLKIKEEIKDKRGIYTSYRNIGLVYAEEREKKKAKMYFKKGLQGALENSDPHSAATFYNDLADAFAEEQDTDSALALYKKALEIFEEGGDKISAADVHKGIGIACFKAKRKTEALQHLNSALATYQEAGDIQGEAAVYEYTSPLNAENGKLNLAINQLEKCLALWTQTGSKTGIGESYLSLSSYYAKIRQFEKAYTYFLKHNTYKDSVFNVENNRLVHEMDAKYQSEKKDKALLKKDADLKIEHAASEKKSLVVYFTIGGLVLVLIFSTFLFRALKERGRANKKILKQKNLLEEKQKEILDSIYYARRIQRALITNEKYIEKKLIILKRNSAN